MNRALLGEAYGVTYGNGSTDSPMTYAYNLSGAMVEQKYPSGRIVKNVLDNDGDLAIVQSKKNANAGYWNYADSFTYTAAGAVSSMQFGNGKWESTQFNSRLQPTRIALGTVQNGTDRLRLDYDYGAWENGVLNVQKNNGNVAKQTITVLTQGSAPGFTAVQKYEYDSLNRLQSATENIDGGQTPSWKQTFAFDRYGNRTFDAGSVSGQYLTTTLPRNCPAEPNLVCPGDNPTANPTNNRLNGFEFDAAGNTIKDPSSRKFTYDGENKQIKVETVNSAGSVTATHGIYFYDGDGKRVKKIGYQNNQIREITTFVYNAGGKMVAEYSTLPNPTPQVSYLTSDHLGSPRINTNENGQIIARHDFQPFGEEIQRASYGEDDVRQKFSSYERDIETDLDFAQARMFSSGFGRFTSPDPSMRVALVNPQSFNKYVYALNNPHKFVDNDGMWPTSIHNLILRLAFPGLTDAQIGRMQDGSYSVDVPWTMFEKYANQHAMRRVDQTVEDAAKEMNSFIAERNDVSQLNNDGGIVPSDNSLFNFGEASHPILDNVSPTHSPFQIFDNSNMFLCVVDPYACYLFWAETEAHMEGESTITSNELNQGIARARENFRRVYGDKVLGNAVGIFSHATYIFGDGPINGENGPSEIQIGNLGIVNIYPDGREVYDGPLKKIK